MKTILLVLSFLSSYLLVKADEGMWLYTMLEKLNIENKGCRLTPEQIYSVNKSSLKDAIIGLGTSNSPTFFFCSAELVSSKGLVFTNHHCGIDLIQRHSSLSNNFVTDGFWAKTHEEELANPELTASILDQIIDLTDSIIPTLDTILEKRKRYIVQDSLIKAFENKNKRKHYSARVVPFFDNNAFYLFTYKTYRDVRLVGTPPQSIGEFGGDTDNWMWPRHTGDFSVLRIYTDSSGAPAEYSSKNIPLETNNHLKISIKGYDKGDFAMILGYPGTTDRYMTSWAIDNRTIANMHRIVIRSAKLDILKKHMAADPAIKIKYITKYKRTSNYWKYFIGENTCVENLNILDKKIAEELALSKWIYSDSIRSLKFNNIFEGTKEYSLHQKKHIKTFNYLYEGLFQGSDILVFTNNINKYLVSLTNNKNEKKDSIKNTAITYIHNYFKNYDIQIDKELFENQLSLFMKNIPKEEHPSFIKKELTKKFSGDVRKYVTYLYRKSKLTNKDETIKIIENCNRSSFASDPAFVATMSVRDEIRAYYKSTDSLDAAFEDDKRMYFQALQQYFPDSLFSPDANSTPRLTYGYINDYTPRDAVHYNYYTTIKGIIEKEDSSSSEFSVHPRLKQLFKSKDYGRYGVNDSMIVCFIANTDITGGNSGSGILNANGELIGIAFDGNWEALSGDTVFEKQKQRTISVDIRYVLFIIDKFAGATNLIDELTLVQ